MHKLFDVANKVALVTGGAQGMGRMIADGLVRAGAKVIITSRKADICEAAVREMSALGNCRGITAELNTPESIVALTNEVKDKEARLDILVNNAGRTWGAPLESFPDEAWPSTMAVNVQGPFTLVRELLPLLKTSASDDDPARVINIGSLAGIQAEKLSAYSYAASKAALHHLSRVLATDLADSRITVNTIVPGYFPTKMTAHIRAEQETSAQLLARIPLGRLGCADDIVGLCVFLSSAAGRYITGTQIALDGGLAASNHS